MMVAFEKISFNVPKRLNIALGIIVVVYSILGLRLWYLQIFRGEYFREKSEVNRIRPVYIQAPRGLILDRNGRVIVKNRPSFNIELIQEDVPNVADTLKRLSEVVGVREIGQRDRYQRKRERFQPRLILRDVSRDVVAKILARKYELPGVVVSVIPNREYIFGNLAAHVIGYIREITNQQLKGAKYVGYRIGDLVGQYGIESKWESLLHGKKGVEKVIVDTTGTRRGVLELEPEISGHTITLTLSLDVQEAADAALNGKSGGIVAMNPNTGEILALASSPKFDPNIFAGEMSPSVWADLISGKEKKLNNRVVQGIYPPGSVFKIVLAVAGLAEGVVKPNEIVNCPGYYYLGRTFRCHKKEGHGPVNLFDAMVQSCDVYFYTVGQRLGVDRINKYAQMFGLGMKTGLDLSEESKGLIPSTEWKKAAFKNPEDQVWYPGETPSVSIGQGAVSVTPLQIARAFSVLINGGRVLTPYIVRSIHTSEGTLLDDKFGSSEKTKLQIDPSILSRVKNSLVGVVNDPRGTGRRAQVDEKFNITVGGKTGTAQVIAESVASKEKHHEDHAWFAGFAPADNPEIVVVAIVENGGHGGVAAAPLVKQVMEAFFNAKEREMKANEPEFKENIAHAT